jgi:putative membrane protein
MKGIFLRTLITLLGLFLASSLIPGVSIAGGWTFILAAILLGLVNGFIRPIAYVLTFPITLVVVTGFWPALFGALIVSFTSTIASWYIGPDGRVEVIVVRQR